jgi:hypothetical protein
MRINYLVVAWPAIDCPDQEAYDISATVDDYFLKAPTRHIAAKLSARAAIHWDDRPGSGHFFYQIRPWRWVLMWFLGEGGGRPLGGLDFYVRVAGSAL